MRGRALLSRRRRRHAKWSGARPLPVLALALWLAACATSPLGRQQLVLFPEAELQQMGVAAFQQMRQELPQATDPSVTRYVRCVADAVIAALPGANAKAWEVRVFRDESANAFALPGGKIGVHTGLLDVAETQDQLAAVIAHEIAHVLAQHSNERVSQQALVSTGLQAAQVLSGTPTPAKQQLMSLLGLGAQVGILLPYSRTQETEADLVGLDLMAAAGFDPRASIALWQNMAKAGNGAPPEFLSTHPSGTTRMEALQERMPHALEIYEAARGQGRRPNCR